MPDFTLTTLPAITTLYACLLGIWIVGLSVWVVLLRNLDQVGIGAGESKRLARAIRVQGNAVEYIPLGLLLMLLLELNGGAAGWLHGFGIALLAGRLLHAQGLGRRSGYSAGRLLGASITLLALLGLAICNLQLIF